MCSKDCRVFTACQGVSKALAKSTGRSASSTTLTSPMRLRMFSMPCVLSRTGRLICVLGCGGDRDRGKRPLMGRIAADKADVVIVTDDNPRSEDPAAIRAEIMAGRSQVPARLRTAPAPIRTAMHDLKPGDVLVVAGKGHETGQIIGDRTLPFSDHDEVRAAIAESRE